MRALRGEFPFQPEIPLAPLLRVGRHHRHEQRALLDLPAEFLVPRIATAQLALVEPYFDAEAVQRVGNAAGRGGILARVAEENRATRRGTLNDRL